MTTRTNFGTYVDGALYFIVHFAIVALLGLAYAGLTR